MSNIELMINIKAAMQLLKKNYEEFLTISILYTQIYQLLYN